MDKHIQDQSVHRGHSHTINRTGKAYIKDRTAPFLYLMSKNVFYRVHTNFAYKQLTIDCLTQHMPGNKGIVIYRQFSWSSKYTHVWYTFSLLNAGYDRVKSQLVTIVRLLKARKDARLTLTRHYKQEGWLEMTENPTEDELLTNALVRMKDNSSQYDKFLAMLLETEGLDMIVNAIKCGHGKILFQC